jgi:DNA polymerase III subunit epsilon
VHPLWHRPQPQGEHGALLDAELLAQLYVEMTGGRQIGLGLASGVDVAALAVVAGTEVRSDRPHRAPRPHGPSEADLVRHAEFIAGIDNAIWLQTA